MPLALKKTKVQNSCRNVALINVTICGSCPSCLGLCEALAPGAVELRQTHAIAVCDASAQCFDVWASNMF